MPRKGVEVQSYSFFNLGARCGCVVNATPSGKTWYPLYGRLGGLQGLYERVRKKFVPTGIRSPAVASRYTDYTIVRKACNKNIYTHVDL
jgi:hypothetical protein